MSVPLFKQLADLKPPVGWGRGDRVPGGIVPRGETVHVQADPLTLGRTPVNEAYMQPRIQDGDCVQHFKHVVYNGDSKPSKIEFILNNCSFI